ncbi:MAG: serine hydrolase domain-containing protein [Acutalibacteraceae bacterium]
MNQQKINELENIITRDYGNIAGMAIMKDGEMLYENYFSGCTADSRIHVYSVTKSIVSLLIGIAIDKGYIKSVEQKVLEFFPGYTLKRGEKTIQNVTLENMLTMTAPYKYKFAPYTKYFTSPDWVKSALDLLGGKGKIGEFRYAPLIGPDILSGILTKVTGQSVLDFAKENLFELLGITIKDHVTFNGKDDQMAFIKATNISGWVADPKGINTAGWGLTLSPVDMAKIGQLCLNCGEWNGRQLVSAEWINKSTTEHVRWEKLNLPYGYLWWVNNDSERGYAAMGDEGNIIYVNTERRLVVAIASKFIPRPKDRIELIKKYIEPAFEN